MTDPMPHRKFRCDPDQWEEANRIARILDHNLSELLRVTVAGYIATNHDLAARYAKVKDGTK